MRINVLPLFILQVIVRFCTKTCQDDETVYSVYSMYICPAILCSAHQFSLITSLVASDSVPSLVRAGCASQEDWAFGLPYRFKISWCPSLHKSRHLGESTWCHSAQLFPRRLCATKTGCRKTGNGADTRLPACSWFYDDMALHLITLLVLSYTVVDTGCSFIAFYPASLANVRKLKMELCWIKPHSVFKHDSYNLGCVLK